MADQEAYTQQNIAEDWIFSISGKRMMNILLYGYANQ